MQLKTMADKDNLEENTHVKSPIIMKVDGPPDDNNSSNSSQDDNNSNERILNESGGKNNLTSRSVATKVPVLAKPKLNCGGNPFAMRLSGSTPKGASSSSLYKPAILRPSKLGQANSRQGDNTNNTIKNPFALKPPQLNPFAKSATNANPAEDNSATSTQSKENDKTPKSSSCSQDENSKPPNTAGTEVPRFVPLTGGQSSNATSNNISTSATPSFVFGQNLHERVVAEEAEAAAAAAAGNCVSSSSANANGTSETLFNVSGESDKINDGPSTSTETKSLSEAAREYEESRAQKRKYEEVTVVTGEENEDNIMQIGCKLFAFDQLTRNWQERGRGNLRLNDLIALDSDNSTFMQSRLVVRATGSLRVVLNTKIWSGMSIELAGPKSIRFTAMDSSGVVKVFLVMANVKEIEKLHKLLKNRLEDEIKRQNTRQENVSSAKRIAVDASGSDPDAPIV